MFKNLSIGTKLLLSFCLVSIFTLIVGLIGFFGAIRLSGNMDNVVGVNMPSILGLAYINEAQTSVQRAERTLLIAGLDRRYADFQHEQLKTAWANVDKGWKMYEALPHTPEEALVWKELVKQWEIWKKDHQRVLSLLAEGSRGEAIELSFGQARDNMVAVESQITKLFELNEKIARTEGAESLDLAFKIEVIAAVATAVGFILSLVLGTIIARAIKRPLENGVAIANRMAQGDLTVQVVVDSQDETGKLMEAMKTMADNLRTIIGQVACTSTQVASAANQLHTTAERIATGAEEVAAQSGTVATAGEEMSATSSDIARNCQGAADGAQLASQAAQNGAEVVDKTVQVMGQIAEKVQETAGTVASLGARSDQIGAIIGTIEDIADQTNLLALNAAIEAARAGEQGRGFAVVADEVRALAERTTRATREIGEMIKAIQNETKGAVAAMEQGVRQVDTGTTEAARSGEALREILHQINDVAMQVSQIATAAEEQTATTAEISSNMQQITEVVLQTSVGAQESATAAAQLSSNAEELQRLVRQFKI